MIDVWLPIFLVNVAAWITPGPNMLAVIAASAAHGRGAGLRTGLGLVAGASVWASAAMLGAEALFRAFPDIALGLRLAGACWLAWLGVKMLRGALAEGEAAPAFAPSRRPFRTGIAVQLTNPKAALFFGSVLTAFTPTDASTGLRAAVVLFCVGFAVVGHAITATVFSAPPARAVFAAARRKISALFGAGFLGLGALAAADAIRDR